jgi:hypothetical protein
MSADTLLASLRGRFAGNKSGRITINADEIAEWPRGLFEQLREAKLLTQTEPAQSLECRGCEEACFMPVNIIAAEGTRPARAFIACDKRSDVGRVPVEFSRLAQWTLTRASFEKTQGIFTAAEQSAGKVALRKSKATVAFRNSLTLLLAEIDRRATAKGIDFNSAAMPGRKIDFKAVANGYDPEFSSLASRTFDDYLDGLVSFKRGARETDFYYNLFPECFKNRDENRR